MDTKKTDNVEMEYDDDACIAFIREQTAGSKAIKALSDDDIMYIIDLVYDFMESRGLMDEDDEEDFEVDLEELYQYVTKNIKRDEFDFSLTEDDFILIYDAEAEYTDTLV
ncbi:hypothetical protein [Porphyromonas sp.]|uniref:hypothetical protein n=1 Tax=Porphyromonas sp. TaxID=1924944 RepID=UPI0026DBD126|nr:hypothetical protein [Porphyromonas sp.]MDO4770589.1 hypothetical protein [Porphyromonas sp.]